MTKSIRIDAEAEDEITHAIDRYENERDGLSLEFWDDLQAAMKTLGAPGPECGPVIGLPRELGVRRKLLHRFPIRDRVHRTRHVRPCHFGHARPSATGVLASAHLNRPIRALVEPQ